MARGAVVDVVVLQGAVQYPGPRKPARGLYLCVIIRMCGRLLHVSRRRGCQVGP